MKYLALLIVLLLMPSVAIAETYQIRVASTVRLRASYSLESAIVERAPAGAVLQVAGQFNRWLKIDRDGETAWLADWVDYTRLDQASAGQGTDSAQASFGVNNCCFLNRQCHSEQEWVDGYWAYQRNECPAQPAPVSLSPAPVDTDAPHRVWNSQGREIPIYGDDVFRRQIARAFYHLRDEVPQWWPYLSIIDDVKSEAGSCNGGYACAGWPYKVVYFEADVSDSDTRSLASTLIHEACHLYQWQEGRGDNYDWSLEWEDRPHEIECNNKEKEAGF